MKRLIALLLLALLLCGCTAQEPEETTETTKETAPAVTPTEPAGSYDPESSLEAATDGAVRVYYPEIPDAYGLAFVGDEPVIFSGTEATTLTKLTGENLYVTATCQMDTWLEPESGGVLITEKGIIWFQRETCQLVLLGTGLKEISRIQLPEDLVGTPVLSTDRKYAYYCTEYQVWEMTLETGIVRLLKEVSQPLVSAETLLLSDGALLCTVSDGENGKQLCLSVETGQTLWQSAEEIAVTGHGENWYAVVPEGLITAYIYGSTDGESRMLLPEDPEAEPRYLELLNCLITRSGNRLDCYDLGTGLRCSTLTLEEAPIYLTGGPDGCIWVLTETGTLCRWDTAALPSGDETVYSGPRYTLADPDAEGYARCAAYAEEIGSRYAVKILFGQEALAVSSGDYDAAGEYMVPVLLEELEKLDSLLAVYPEGILKAAVADTTGGTLYICLVREITGSVEFGIQEAVGGFQFWQGDDAYVFLAVGQETGNALYHQMYHVMETRLLSKSNDCYEWESLNPKDFAYDYSYVLNRTREDGGWLEGENRYFIDLYSMSFPREDRARILEYAMMEGNEAYFESEAMQAKLKALCTGIREAYGLKKSPDTFLWEQYLKESLAYTK